MGVIRAHQTVLVVSDDAGVRASYCRTLAPLPVNVLEADDSRRAIALLDDLRPDVAVVDLELEGAGGGLDLLRHATRTSAPTRLYVVTRADDAASAAEALELGAVELIARDACRPEHLMRWSTTPPPTLVDVPAVSTSGAPGAHGRPQLRHRLPNPPPRFVGRSSELERLRGAIERAPLTLVWGPGGVGKSALVLEALHRCFPARVDATLHLKLVEGDSPDALGVHVVRAIARAAGGGGVDWTALASDPEALVATAIDLAESGGWWLVLDDLHHWGASEVRSLSTLLARYARSSRWVALTRLDPSLDAELEPQVLALGGMPHDDLAELARAWVPNVASSDSERAVALAAGSPWQLRQLLRGEDPRPADSEPTTGLNRPALEILGVLALLRRPIPTETVCAICEVDEALPALGLLSERGLVELLAAGWQVHDAARPYRSSDARDTTRDKARIAAGLACAPSPLAGLEALRLFVELGRVDSALDLLEARGATFVGQGFAPELWQLLAGADDPRLEAWRMRTAVEAADSAALATLSPPRGRGAAARLAWGRVLLARAEHRAAAALAAELADEAGLDASSRFEAALLRCRALALGGDLCAALAVCEGLEAPDRTSAVRRAVERGELFLRLGRHDGAWDAVVALGACDDDSPSAPRIAWILGSVLLERGVLGGAAAVVERAVSRLPPQGVATESGRRLRRLAAELALHAGRLDEAGPLSERHGGRGGRVDDEVEARMLDARRRFELGELDSLEAEVAWLSGSLAGGGAAPALLDELQLLDIRLRSLRGAPIDLDAAARSQPPAEGSRRQCAWIASWEAALRAGAETSMPRVDAGSLVREAPARAYIAGAVEALLRGEAGSARNLATSGAIHARRGGYACVEADARRLLCDVLTVAEAIDDVAQAVSALGELSAELAAPRLMRDLEWARIAAARTAPDPAALESLAQQAEVSPVAARRARACLGEAALLDAVDRMVIAAVRRHGWTIETVSAAPPSGRGDHGWGIDATRSSVWLPRGRTVALGAGTLSCTLLRVLCDEGGAATKETLVTRTWGKEYHPLRDDNRLRLAIRKLRRIVEDDPLEPARVVTTTDGYALGGTARRLRAEVAATRTST